MRCAKGIVCVSSYANLFLAQFEEKYIYIYIKDMPVLYLRYSDDIFIK